MHKTLAFLLFILPLTTLADTFIVTSNADSGPGTLRDALLQAAANGTTVKDNIIFNIADVSEAGRTIVLQSTLPDLTSNLLIDGSTQPGTAFGITDARIKLTIGSLTDSDSFLYMYAGSSSSIEVDGLFFYQPYWNGFIQQSQAIHLDGCSNIQIGRPKKGNYFLGFTYTLSNVGFSKNNIYINTPAACSNITIQSNVEGINPDGSLSYQLNGHVLYYAQKSIYFSNTQNLLIGGNTVAEGNHIVSACAVDIESCFSNEDNYLNIYNNRFGTDINDSMDLQGGGSIQPSYILLRGITSSVDIKNNIIGNKIDIQSITKYFYIRGNVIYCPDHSTADNRISVTGTAGGMIGGENDADANEIHRGGVAASNAIFDADTKVTIYKNKIYCNQHEASPVNYVYYYDLKDYASPYHTFPWVLVDSTSKNYVKGRAKPNCKIDVYQDDECTACEGKLFLGSTNSDANGNWLYTGNFTGVVVAAATDADGTTFAFSYPFVKQDSIKIVMPACGKKTGSIKGAKIVGGDNWEWHNVYLVGYEQRDSLFSRNLDIDHLAPGTYVLRPKLGGTCFGISAQFVLPDVTPGLNEIYAEVQQPTCGKNTGAISGIGGSNLWQARLEWRDEKGQVLGNAFDISGLFAGTYTLYAIDTSGAGCIDSSKKYVLVNQSGPSLITSAANITNATCGKNNGSIKGVTYKNTAGNIYTGWVDSAGNIIATSLDLENVPAGKYRLKFKDEGGCDTITGPVFSIISQGSITIDSSNMLIKQSSCKGADGSITGITATNANNFNWINTTTNNTAGNTVDANNLPPGTYTLTVSNSFGCKVTTNPVTVGQSGFMADTVKDVTVLDASCYNNNGNIQIRAFTHDASQYSFQWVAASTNASIPGTVVLKDLPPDTYSLFATDINGCRQVIFTAAIKQLGKQQYNYTTAQITNDTCNLGTGKISGLQVSGSAKQYNWQWFTSAGTGIGNTSSIGQLKAGDYYAITDDGNGCIDTSKTFTVNNYDMQFALPAVDDHLIPRGSAARLQVSNTVNGTYVLFDTIPAVTPVQTSATGSFITPAVLYDKLFYVQYQKGDCSTALKQVWVKVFDSTVVIAVNAFSPNNDGINDTWRVQLKGVLTNYKLNIVNRYGQSVFTANNISQVWDGTLNGSPLPVGTYYYFIQGTDQKNNPVKLTGYIVLLR